MDDTSALHSRRNKSSMRLSSCFSRGHHRGSSFDVSSSAMPSPLVSPSTWIRSKTHDLPVPEIKGKCKKIISRMGRHRRHSSAEFSYDPLSYALNFEENDEPSEWDQEPIPSFASRLPVSPPRVRAVNAIAASESSLSPLPAGGFRVPSMTPRTSELPASRVLAVAEVQKSLELSSPGTGETPATDVKKSHELPTPPRREASSTRSGEVGELRVKVAANAAAEQSKSIEKSTPRAAAVAEVRRSLEDVTPSRQVLVGLF